MRALSLVVPALDERSVISRQLAESRIKEALECLDQARHLFKRSHDLLEPVYHSQHETRWCRGLVGASLRLRSDVASLRRRLDQSGGAMVLPHLVDAQLAQQRAVPKEGLANGH